jgi:hypothetical protein
MKFRLATCLIIMLCSVSVRALAQAQHVSLEEMVQSSGTIVSGRVVRIKAGHHPEYPNVAVTYVTVDIEAVFKDAGARVAQAGPSGARRLTFMQFGNLLTLRVHDLPAYRQGEDIFLFLYPESQYGFTSPVGGLQGKFTVTRDSQTGRRVAANGINNFDLFRTLDAEQLQLSSAERKIIHPSRHGAVDYDGFASVVRKLVKRIQ